jgi:hypothetical protein
MFIKHHDGRILVVVVRHFGARGNAILASGSTARL